MPQRCTAKSKRSQQRCRAWSIRGKDKCRMHGGTTPIKHGLRSKYLRGTLGELIAEHEADPKLMDLRSHVAVLSALQTRMLGPLAKKEDEASLSEDEIEAVRKVTDSVTKAIERYEKTQQQPENLVPLELVGQLIDLFSGAINRYVADDAARRAILTALDSGLRLPTPTALH